MSTKGYLENFIIIETKTFLLKKVASMKKKILTNQWIPDECVASYLDEFEFIYPDPKKFKFTRQELLELITDADVFYNIRIQVDRQLIEAGKKLKIVATHAVGYDNIDVKCCNEYGLPVVLCSNEVTEATAEMTIALMLAVTRGVVRYDKEVRDGIWSCVVWFDRDTQLFGHKLGVVGFGRIGKAVARKARGLGMKVYYYDAFRANPEVEAEYNVTYLPFDELLASCDHITLHLPYTKESHHLMNDATFAKMMKGAYLFNAARGAVVDEAALVRALQSGQLHGAGLDVFEFEPKITEELLHMDNVVMTPHAGSQTLETRIKMWKEGMSAIIGIYKGERPHNVVNPEVFNK